MVMRPRWYEGRPWCAYLMGGHVELIVSVGVGVVSVNFEASLEMEFQCRNLALGSGVRLASTPCFEEAGL